MKTAWIVTVLALASGLAVRAQMTAPVIDVGTHSLQPDMAGQTVQIFVSGDTAVQGLNLDAQVANGYGTIVNGTDMGSPPPGPKITGVDLLTGTIFAANHAGGDPQDPGSYPQLAIRTLATASGTVPAGDGQGGPGLLATLTLDTTGFTSGTWDLKLAGTLNGNTDFAGLAANIQNGSLVISAVPEPSAYAAVFGIGCAAAAVALKRLKRAD